MDEIILFKKDSRTVIELVDLVLKELNETFIWLQIIERSQMMKRELLVDIIQENGDLCKIFTASLNTARRQANDKK